MTTEIKKLLESIFMISMFMAIAFIVTDNYILFVFITYLLVNNYISWRFR